MPPPDVTATHVALLDAVQGQLEGEGVTVKVAVSPEEEKDFPGDEREYEHEDNPRGPDWIAAP